MPHSIRVGLLGLTDLGEKMFRGIMDRDLIASNCLFVADTNQENLKICSEYGIQGYTELTAPMTRSEVIFLHSTRREFSSMLSAICGTTRGKVLVSTVEGRDCDYILERVAKATQVVCARIVEEEGVSKIYLTYSKNFPNWKKTPIIDILGTIGEVQSEEAAPAKQEA
ncbi:MAG: NAD(P)-binding domain-containing protein [Butyricicoccaceae bacterium]